MHSVEDTIEAAAVECSNDDHENITDDNNNLQHDITTRGVSLILIQLCTDQIQLSQAERKIKNMPLVASFCWTIFSMTLVNHSFYCNHRWSSLIFHMIVLLYLIVVAGRYVQCGNLWLDLDI